jgi:hypothetical protein
MEMSSDKRKENLRLSFGPYKKEESKKYFILENEIKEGLIFDVDVWQRKVKIPNFKIKERVSSFEKSMASIFPKITEKMIEEIKNDSN